MIDENLREKWRDFLDFGLSPKAIADAQKEAEHVDEIFFQADDNPDHVKRIARVPVTSALGIRLTGSFLLKKGEIISNNEPKFEGSGLPGSLPVAFRSKFGSDGLPATVPITYRPLRMISHYRTAKFDKSDVLRSLLTFQVENLLGFHEVPKFGGSSEKWWKSLTGSPLKNFATTAHVEPGKKGRQQIRDGRFSSSRLALKKQKLTAGRSPVAKIGGCGKPGCDCMIDHATMKPKRMTKHAEMKWEKVRREFLKKQLAKLRLVMECRAY